MISVPEILDQIESDIDELRVLGVSGLNCMSLGRKEDEVGVLHVCTHRGLCYEQCLSSGRVSNELKRLLEDATILKVGVAIASIAEGLCRYGINVNNTFDLRAIALRANYPPTKIDEMVENYLVQGNRDAVMLTQICSHANCDRNSNIQEHLCAAYSAIKLFKFFGRRMKSQNATGRDSPVVIGRLSKICDVGSTNIPTLKIVSNLDDFPAAMEEIKSHCEEFNALGFDCNWVPARFRTGKRRGKVAVLQLCTHRRLCVLFQVIQLGIPDELKEILENGQILKLCVSPRKYVKALKLDYRIQVEGMVDIRHMIPRSFEGVTSKEMALEYLGLPDRAFSSNQIHRNWQCDTLPGANIAYAIRAPSIAIDLFKYFFEQLEPPRQVTFHIKNCYEALPRKPCHFYYDSISNMPHALTLDDDPPPEMELHVISDEKSCRDLLNRMESQYKDFGALGFDCEWVPGNHSNKQRGKLAILQLCTHQGLCAVIQLLRLERIPDKLKMLLENGSILKVGIVPEEDADKLQKDYGIHVRGTLDLRFMACDAGLAPGGLKKLARKYLELEHSKRPSHKFWDFQDLPEKNVEYAAKDAYFGIELFKYFYRRLNFQRNVHGAIDFYRNFLNKRFKFNQYLPRGNT